MRRSSALWLAVALAGCPSETPECRLHSDCVAGFVCAAGKCAPECREDRDCGAQGTCVSGRCVGPDPSHPFCVTQDDCAEGQTCQAGACGVVSLVGRDAGATGFDAAGSSDAGAVADGGAADASAAGLPYGAVCSRAAECATALCLGPAGAPTGRCTRFCGADTDCYYPDRCVDVPGAGRLCGPSATGRAAGEPCPNGPADCSTGLCLQIPQTAPVCTHQCSPLPSCPAMMSCAPIPDGQGGAIAVCVPGAGAGFGESCSGAAQCASTLCVGLAGGASGVCTAFCDTVPCPLGWACNTVSDGAGGTAQVCAPGSAAGGGFGASCNGASECASGLCLHDARLGAAFCTQSCASSQDCAQIAGLACVVLSSGQPVCAPP